MQCIHSDGQATQLLSHARALFTVCGVVFRAGMSKAIQSHLIEHPLICWSPSCWCVLCSRTHLYAPVTTRLFACKRGACQSRCLKLAASPGPATGPLACQ